MSDNKDPNQGDYYKIFAKEFQFLQSLLFNYHNYTYELQISDKQYQAFRMIINGNTFVFHPHRTTAGNTHLRVYVQIEKDYELCKDVIEYIYQDSTTSKYPILMSNKTLGKYIRTK